MAIFYKIVDQFLYSNKNCPSSFSDVYISGLCSASLAIVTTLISTFQGCVLHHWPLWLPWYLHFRAVFCIIGHCGYPDIYISGPCSASSAIVTTLISTFQGSVLHHWPLWLPWYLHFRAVFCIIGHCGYPDIYISGPCSASLAIVTTLISTFQCCVLHHQPLWLPWYLHFRAVFCIIGHCDYPDIYISGLCSASSAIVTTLISTFQGHLLHHWPLWLSWYLHFRAVFCIIGHCDYPDIYISGSCSASLAIVTTLISTFQGRVLHHWPLWLPWYLHFRAVFCIIGHCDYPDIYISGSCSASLAIVTTLISTFQGHLLHHWPLWLPWYLHFRAIFCIIGHCDYPDIHISGLCSASLAIVTTRKTIRTLRTRLTTICGSSFARSRPTVPPGIALTSSRYRNYRLCCMRNMVINSIDAMEMIEFFLIICINWFSLLSKNGRFLSWCCIPL